MWPLRNKVHTIDYEILLVIDQLIQYKKILKRGDFQVLFIERVFDREKIS